jgi:hypothetical protein
MIPTDLFSLDKPWRHAMNRDAYAAAVLVALFSSSGNAHAATDVESAFQSGKTAFESGSYLAVDDYITAQNSKHNWIMQSLSGDAAFMRNDPSAYRRYTNAWVTRFDQDWDATKGDSKFWKALAIGTAVLGVATGYQQAQQGITTNVAADSIGASAKMLGSLEETTGDKNARKNVKRVMADLRKLAKQDSSSFQIIFPQYSLVAGAGMARVHSSRGVCSAFRVAQGQYGVSRECLTKMGSPGATELGVTIGTTLQPEDFAKVISADYSRGDVVLTVAPGKADVSNMDWHSFRGDTNTMAKATEFGVTWFAAEFDYLVPVFQACSTPKFDDCGDIRANNALMWAKADGAWFWVGFADAGYPVP